MFNLFIHVEIFQELDIRYRDDPFETCSHDESASKNGSVYISKVLVDC